MTTRTALFLSFLGGFGLAVGCSDDSHPSVDGGHDGGVDLAVDRPADADAKDLVADQSNDGDVAGDAGADVGQSPDTGPLLAAQSFTGNATLTFTARGSSFSQPIGPVTQSMMLRFDPTTSKLVVSQAGYVAELDVRSKSGSTFETTTSFTLPLSVSSTCNTQATFETLEVGASPSGLSAHGSGIGQAIFGDVAVSYDVAFAFVGLVDMTPPSVGGNRTNVDPLGPLYLPLSEPIVATATARLSLSGVAVDLVTNKTTHATGFTKPEAIALAYGATYNVGVNPWRDLAQIPGGDLPTVTTQAAPILIAEDGFEAETGATIGGAAIVQAPTFPVPAGTKAAIVAADDTYSNSRRMTVRLARQPGDTVVRATLRPVSRFEGTASTYGVSLRVAIPGGAIVSAQLPMNEPVMTRYQQQPGNGIVFVGTPRTVELALPAAPSAEVVVDLANAWPGGCGLLPPRAGYIIDDLRLE